MVSEIALSFILLVGAGLLIKSFIRLREVNPGFNPSNMLTMRVSLPAGKYQEGEPRVQVYRQVVERISGVPGVASAGAISQLPLRGDTFNLGRGYLREGDPQTSEAAGNANFLTVTAAYFDTMKIPLKAGRAFTEQPVDLMTFLSVAAILIIVALLACVIPARKAARVDPLVALRYE